MDENIAKGVESSLNISAIVVAAGQGKRMKSKLYKVLHPICGKPMVGHVVDSLVKIKVDRTIVVVGHGAEDVKSYLGNRVHYVLQKEQLGTGHAVLQVKPEMLHEAGITIVICGDTPLIRPETLQHMITLHQEKKSAATILTAIEQNPHGYGRIIRDKNQHVTAIVEQKDCTAEQANLTEINTATYCFDNQKLFAALALVTNDNQQHEYYLTDVVRILATQGEAILGYCLEDSHESIGVNDRIALSYAEKYMRKRINEAHMTQGVTLIDPEATYIDTDVEIGSDTVIFPQTQLLGNTRIGENCKIGPLSEIRDCQIEDDVVIRQSILDQAFIGQQSNIGPFAYLRPGTKIGKQVKIGDFVEIKNSTIGNGTKIPHLSYVGDAIVGQHVNIGCGAITANYDGINKHTTQIGDDVFIGSNVNLIAPVSIGNRAYVVAGSTITKNVAEEDLAIAREKQVNKPGYANVIRARTHKAQED